MKHTSKGRIYASWAAQIIAAAILAMAMVPKFTGAADAIETFTTLGAEPWGRYFVGALELIAVVLLVVPWLHRHALGALAAAGLMSGALASHVWKLGFAGDAATMAAMATVVLLSSLTVLALRRDELPVFAKAQ